MSLHTWEGIRAHFVAVKPSCGSEVRPPRKFVLEAEFSRRENLPKQRREVAISRQNQSCCCSFWLQSKLQFLGKSKLQFLGNSKLQFLGKSKV